MRPIAVLVQIDTLPGSQGRTPVDDRDRNRGMGQRGPDVGRHVIGSFGSVAKERISGRNEATQEGFEIAHHDWIAVFLYYERR